MKKIVALLIGLCLAGTTSAFAYGNRGGGYYDRPYERHYSHSHHRHNGLGVALGVVGGLVLGSALVNAAAPPPPAVVYAPPRYVPPRVCYQDRVVSGEWQVNRWGRQVWVEYAYPVTRRMEVPCY